MSRALTWLRGHVAREASSLPLALLRVLLALILWTRFAVELLPFRRLEPDHLALSLAFFVTTTWMLLGWWGRAGTLACAAVVDAMVFGLGRTSVPDWGHHHTTVLAYAVTYVALGDNSRSLSIDRWLELRAAEREGRAPAPQRAPVWPLTLIAMQLSTVYLWSAFDKVTQPGFLAGDRLVQVFLDVWWSSDWRMPGIVTSLSAVTAWTVVALEVALPIGLWFRRTQGPLLLVGAVLHALFYTLLPVGTFSVTMVACYLAYLDPDAVEGAVRRLLGGRPDEPPAARS